MGLKSEPTYATHWDIKLNSLDGFGVLEFATLIQGEANLNQNTLKLSWCVWSQAWKFQIVITKIYATLQIWSTKPSNFYLWSFDVHIEKISVKMQIVWREIPNTIGGSAFMVS